MGGKRLLPILLGFRSEFDGHTLDQATEQVERVSGQKPENGICDRGYKGRSKARDTLIHLPKAFSKHMSAYLLSKQRKHFCKRAGIEPVISHLKADHRLSRNFYKGIFGDNINVMLPAAAFNFKRMMNKWKASFWLFWERMFFLLNKQFFLIRNYHVLQVEGNRDL